MADQLSTLDLLPPRLPAPSLPAFDQLPQESLSDFVYTRRSWSRDRKTVARRTTLVLWVLAAFGLASCVELISLVRSTAACTGLACSVATFGGHTLLTLLLAAAGTTALLATAAFTRGFTRMSGNSLWAVVSAAGLTFASVAGVLAILVASALIMIVAILAVTVFFACFADHS
jgi:hypothetical protein